MFKAIMSDPAATVSKYNQRFPADLHPAGIELAMMRHGGQWKKKNGEMAGEGMLFHFKAFIRLVWPHIKFHKWNEIIFENYFTHRTVGILGCASSGKTNSAALCVLVDYYTWPECTTVICCSTTKERLEDRVWGEIKNLHKRAVDKCGWIPGNVIEGRQRIITDPKTETAEGRDFRNGLMGVPCQKGTSYVGMGSFAGVKNDRVRLLGDELSMLPAVFIHAVSNLDKNTDFKCLGLGNPKDTIDALGLFCEPSTELGGWDGGIDQTPLTKTWPTRRPNGICIQLPGTDSPNLDGKLGIPLITQEQIDRDVAFYGRDSLWFTMFNQGMMPRGQGTRRILTRPMCLKFHAVDEPNWKNTNRTKIGFLDAAYRGVGGDRCVFGELQFGEEAAPLDGATLVSNLLAQSTTNPKNRMILALIDTVVVPIKGIIDELPEDQIVNFVMAQCATRGIAPENFFFDAGMKASLATAFSRIWSSNVMSVDFGGRPSERPVTADNKTRCCDFYSKFVTELWFSVRLVVEAGQFRGMTEDCMLEFCAREWTIVGANKHEVETKDAVKEKTGRSPDLADAIAIGVEGARQRGFQIMRLGNDNRRSMANDQWRRDLRAKAEKYWKSGTLVDAK